MLANSKTTLVISLLGSLLLPGLGACSGGGGGSPSGGPESPGTPAAPFLFSTAEDLELELVVTLDGVPVAGVPVQILSPRGAAEAVEDGDNETFFSSVTGAEGRLKVYTRVPARFEAVDLVVDHPRATGPYTDEQLRAIAGPFAPSSRIRLDRGVASLQVALSGGV